MADEQKPEAPIPPENPERPASAGAPSDQDIEEARIQSGLSIAEREKREARNAEDGSQA